MRTLFQRLRITTKSNSTIGARGDPMRYLAEVVFGTQPDGVSRSNGFGTLRICLLQAFGIVDCSNRLRAQGPYIAGMRHGHEPGKREPN
jgi:hypothetical protein